MSFFNFSRLGLFAATVLAITGVSAYPNPPTIEGNITWIHDPAIVRRADGTLFRFATDGGIAIATAPALTGPWEYQGAMLPDGSITHIDDEQHLWVCTGRNCLSDVHS
jgi:arabinan endo-1,5-alpha-L-arabinosidase